jgi:hypothetical protein
MSLLVSDSSFEVDHAGLGIMERVTAGLVIDVWGTGGASGASGLTRVVDGEMCCPQSELPARFMSEPRGKIEHAFG